MNMADLNKSCEAVGNHTVESAGKIGEAMAKVSIDVSEAITGLKALQREARATTKALREY